MTAPTGRFAAVCLAAGLAVWGSSAADTRGRSLPTGNSNVDAGIAVIKVGGQSWTFSFREGPAVRCKTDMLANKGGIYARGHEIGSDGVLLPDGSRLELNIYPEKWVRKGTQYQEISIVGPGDKVNWRTAGPTLIKDNPGAKALTRAVVHSWKLQGGWTSGTATFYLVSSLPDAQMGGKLEMADGTFELLCPKK